MDMDPTTLLRSHHLHKKEPPPNPLTISSHYHRELRLSDLCFVCNRILQTGKVKAPKRSTSTSFDHAGASANLDTGIDNDVLMLLRLKGYPDRVLRRSNSFTAGLDHDHDQGFSSDSLNEQLSSFEICDECEGSLQQVCALITQVEELHRQIVQARSQISQLIHTSMESDLREEDFGLGLLIEVRQRVLQGLQPSLLGFLDGDGDGGHANQMDRKPMPGIYINPVEINIKQEPDALMLETEDTLQCIDIDPQDFLEEDQEQEPLHSDYEDGADSNSNSHHSTPSQTPSPSPPPAVKRGRGRRSKADLLKNPLKTPFKCKHCPSAFARLSNLRWHCKRKHPEHPSLPTKYDFPHTAPKTRFNCSFCPQIFARSTSIRAHCKKRHPDQPLPKAVRKTGPKRRPRSQLDDEPEPGPRTCPTCSEVFVRITEKEYAKHLRKHTKPYKCKVEGCTAEFETPLKLRTHCIRSHSELKLQKGFTCPHCDFVSSQSATVKEHVTAKHEAHLKVGCTVEGCRFRTPNPTRMKQHIERVHEGKKNYLCTECGKGYYFQNKLAMHMRSHTGERPFECPVCKKRFFGRRSMHRHLPIHGDERPFACELCGMRFPTRNNLYGHLQSWHKGGGERIGVQPTRKGKYN